MKLLKTTNTLFAPNITSQVKHGVSGDGQMIVNTGLLPISQGSAAAKYGNNVFPNIAHFYQNLHKFKNRDTINARIIWPKS